MNEQLEYASYPDPAAMLRTFLLSGAEVSWRQGVTKYARSDTSSRQKMIADIDALMSNHAATEEAVRMWIRAHTSSQVGLLEEGVSARREPSAATGHPSRIAWNIRRARARG
jgi:hypothetical protein